MSTQPRPKGRFATRMTKMMTSAMTIPPMGTGCFVWRIDRNYPLIEQSKNVGLPTRRQVREPQDDRHSVRLEADYPRRLAMRLRLQARCRLAGRMQGREELAGLVGPQQRRVGQTGRPGSTRTPGDTAGWPNRRDVRRRRRRCRRAPRRRRGRRRCACCACFRLLSPTRGRPSGR
jgi:hypothetical protein